MNVAVIIPTCERQDLLRRAIDSVRKQTKQPHEIIVVNDAPWSPVRGIGPARIIETTGKRGCGMARKLAMSVLDPQTECVCYLDDDDVLLPNHLELLSQAIKNGAPYAFSKAKFIYPDGFETEDPEPQNKGKKSYYDSNALLSQNIAPVSSFMHTRAAHDEVGGWDPSIARLEDWDFWGRLFIRYGPPKFVDAVTNVIHKGGSSNMTTSNPFVYSLACSWRDIVSDRLKYMAKTGSTHMSEGESKQFLPPRVGIVLPIYNAEKYLRQSIESLLSQTYQDFEILAVDDGSIDGSIRTLVSYQDKRIRVFPLAKNHGVTKALNHGLLVSRSELIARMDADDVSVTDRIEKQVAFLDANKDIDVVGTCFWSLSEDLGHLVWANGRNDCPPSHDEIVKTIASRCCMGHPTVMMRRSLIESIGGYSEKPEHKAVEDYELWLRAISKGRRMANLGEFLLKHRVYPNQVSSTMSSIQNENAAQLRVTYKELIK